MADRGHSRPSARLNRTRRGSFQRERSTVTRGDSFVFGVIVAGPLVGLALAWPAERVGSWVIAITMASAFVFGCVNHFVLAGPDHVSQVAERWRPIFTTTAVLLAGTEALASALAVRIARARRVVSVT